MKHDKKLLTQDERATYQAMIARGYSEEDALSDAFDGVHVDDVRSSNGRRT